MSYDAAPQPVPPSPGGRPGAPAQAWYRKTGVIIGGAAVVGLLIGTGIGSSATKTKDVAGPSTTVTATATTTAPAPAPLTETLKPTIVKTIATRTRIRSVVYTPPPLNEISDRVYKVGPDVPAGTYRTKGGADCYYAILNSTSTSDIADNNNFTGPQIITLRVGKYLEISGGCSWSRER